MTDQTPFKNRGTRVFAEHVAQQLVAAFDGDADQADTFAADTEGDPERLLAAVGGAPVFCDRFSAAGIGCGVADGFAGLALVLRGGPGIANAGVALLPHEATALLADLSIAVQDVMRFPAFQTEEVDRLAVAVEEGLADIKLSSARRGSAMSATEEAHRAGKVAGLIAAAEAIDAAATLLGDADGHFSMLADGMRLAAQTANQ
jgi:hypothetical protein